MATPLIHPPETAAARGWVDTLDIKTPGLGAAVDTLSGGNQQKVVSARWLDTAPQILILNEPTRGVDVGAKVEIYNTLELMCKKKIGVIMISSELPEIMATAPDHCKSIKGRYNGRGECLGRRIFHRTPAEHGDWRINNDENDERA